MNDDMIRLVVAVVVMLLGMWLVKISIREYMKAMHPSLELFYQLSCAAGFAAILTGGIISFFYVRVFFV